MDGFREIAASIPGETSAAGWCAAVLGALADRRDGPAEDDTLLVRIVRAPA